MILRLIVFSAGMGCIAFAIFSFLTAETLRGQFLAAETPLTVREIAAAPLKGLAGLFLGVALLASANDL